LSNVGDITDEKDWDQTLWLRFKSGDPDSLGMLAEIHYRALYNYGVKFSRDPDFVQDCIQDLYLDLWEKRGTVSETSFVKSYLFKSLRHKIFKETIRLRRFQSPKEIAFDADDVEVPLETLMIGDDLSKQQITHLNQIISGLTNRQREVIYLRFYQGLDLDRITEIMGLGRQSTSNLLYRTLKEMREQWLLVDLTVLLMLLMS
jgi:RNA polymerase sigma factor (sigma-70 family)